MGSRTLMPVAFSYTIPSGSRQRTTSLSRAGDIDWNRSIGPEKNARILLSKNQFSFPKIFGGKNRPIDPELFPEISLKNPNRKIQRENLKSKPRGSIVHTDEQPSFFRTLSLHLELKSALNRIDPSGIALRMSTHNTHKL